MRFATLAGCAGLLLLAAPAGAADVTGAWNTGKARVRIADCGSGLCATITALNEPNDAAGKPKTDRNNADASKRSRRIVGISILSGMKPAGDSVWKGSIYNPEDGKTYSASMTLQGSSLKVEGCALAIICRTQVWSR